MGSALLEVSNEADARRGIRYSKIRHHLLSRLDKLFRLIARVSNHIQGQRGGYLGQ